MLYCDHQMCLEGNQSLNITFKTWINKISTDSDFNSKDLITRKIWFINQIENGRKTTANSQATASTVAWKLSSIPPFIQLYSTLTFNRIIPSRSLKTIILDCYSVLCDYSKVYVLIRLDQTHTELFKLYVDYFLII